MMTKRTFRRYPNKVSLKDWLVTFGVVVGILAAEALVFYGAWQLLIDSGRAILH